MSLITTYLRFEIPSFVDNLSCFKLTRVGVFMKHVFLTKEMRKRTAQARKGLTWKDCSSKRRYLGRV